MEKVKMVNNSTKKMELTMAVSGGEKYIFTFIHNRNNHPVDLSNNKPEKDL